MKGGASFKKAINKRSEVNQALCSLAKYIPFLGNNGILRVGGRLEYACDVREEAKHPAILPYDHHIFKLFILDRHKTKLLIEYWLLLSADAGVRLAGEAKTVRSYIKGLFYSTSKLLHVKRSEQLMAPGYKSSLVTQSLAPCLLIMLERMK